MTARARTALRSLLIAGGAGVGIASVLAIRIADWPIYLVFLALSVGLFIPALEILPRIRFAIAEMAAVVGFLYVGGLPIILLHWLAPWLTRSVVQALPESWREGLRRFPSYPDLSYEALAAGGQRRIGMLAEWSNFSLGLAARYWVATRLSSTTVPISDPAVILAAEVAGYVVWGTLSRLSIYPDRPLITGSLQEETQTAFSDITLVVVLALTPFVFLIAYGYRLHGLAGAAGWSLGTLGLHTMLRRLNERRLRVEEQNRRLEALNRELEHRERLSAIGKMSSVVSHQILQQLGVIGIYADLIRHGGEDEEPNQALEQARDNAVAIEGALGDVNRVLTDLLVFSRDLRLNLYAHPLCAVAEEIVEECRAEAAQHRVGLRAECSASVDVTVDKLKVKQALLNVVRNAIQASPEGGEVVVAASAEDGEAEIAVSDHGSGVPEKDREAVFTPFFTTKEQGSGLGLAIARVFVEAHGGRIWVEPARPRGAVFRVRLPIAGPRASTAAAGL